MAYLGHDEGRDEFDSVSALLQRLPPDRYVCSETKLLNRKLAPRLLSVWKLRNDE